MGGERTFAASAKWKGQREESGHSGHQPVFSVVQTQRKSAESPMCRIFAMQLKSAITVEAKTFNNHLGFERGLWQHQTRGFASVPQRSVFGTNLKAGSAEEALIEDRAFDVGNQSS
jgi:hypothetical protein